MGNLASTAWGRQGAVTLRAGQFAPPLFSSLRRGALLGWEEIVPYATAMGERPTYLLFCDALINCNKSASGGSTRLPIMTAYRQQALACAAALAQVPARPRDLKPKIPDAPKILLSNVYGWFVRVERGVYTLSEAGKAALVRRVLGE
jgi:hypothetical protein